MSNQIASPVVNSSGKTRLRDSLERAKRGEGPSVGQWLEFPGYTLARTIAPLGEDVCALRGVQPSQEHPPDYGC
jgi:4-hydroxy-2-oxoheptanedioate aldolase